MMNKHCLNNWEIWKNQCCVEIDDDEKMPVMRSPKEYQMIMVTKHRGKGMGLTLNNIKSAMSQPWRSMYGERTNQNMGVNEDCNSELGLGRQFNGTCHDCGQWGHKKANCPKLKKGQNLSENLNKKKFNGTCHLCGKVRYKKENCWFKPKNEHLHPAWFHGSHNVNYHKNRRISTTRR